MSDAMELAIVIAAIIGHVLLVRWTWRFTRRDAERVERETRTYRSERTVSQ